MSQVTPHTSHLTNPEPCVSCSMPSSPQPALFLKVHHGSFSQQNGSNRAHQMVRSPTPHIVTLTQPLLLNRWHLALETKSIPKPSRELIWPPPPAPSLAAAVTRKSPRRPVHQAADATTLSVFLHNVHALVLPDPSSGSLLFNRSTVMFLTSSAASRWSSAARDCLSVLRRHGARCSTAAALHDDACITHVIVLAQLSELSPSESEAAAATSLSASCARAHVVTTAWLEACVAAGVCVCECWGGGGGGGCLSLCLWLLSFAIPITVNL
jgi:hypothetical protein